MIITYCICSGSSKQHRAEANLSPKFFRVIHGWSVFISKEEHIQKKHHTDEISKLILGRELLRGEVGSSLAHQQIYRHHLSNSEEWVLVLEDDAELVTETLHFEIAHIIDQMSNGKNPLLSARIILLGHHVDSTFVYPNRKLTKQTAIPTGSFGYLINRAASHELLEQPISFVADWPIRSHRINFFACSPALVRHSRQGPSTVGTISQIPRKTVDGTRGSFWVRISRIRTGYDAVLFWHFVVKRGLAFRYMLPTAKFFTELSTHLSRRRSDLAHLDIKEKD